MNYGLTPTGVLSVRGATSRRADTNAVRTARLFSLKRFLVVISVLLSLVFACVAAFVVTQYRDHARLVDARLAAGYTSSRAGIYAAPRVLLAGAKLTPERLVEHLRRIDYVPEDAGEIWNGSFTIEAANVLIKPRRDASSAGGERGFAEVHVGFTRDRIASITGDSIPLTSYTLEPELLTKDAGVKTDSRSALAFTDLPPHLVRAILAIEDRRFFEHEGVDARGVARALWSNIRASRTPNGETSSAAATSRQGGSTITQQLVKNTYLSPERTWRRKFSEALIAIALERRLTKNEIFALYCNEIHLGQRAGMIVRGVGQAARIFFGKDVRDLTLAEAATIAGMIQSPRTFAPDRAPEAARARRDVVLNAMVAADFVSQDDAHIARAEEMNAAPVDPSSEPRAPYFLDYVDRLAAAASIDGDAPTRIHTTLDTDLQQIAEAALARGLDRLAVTHRKQHRAGARQGITTPAPQGALVAIDPHDGRVLAMVGGGDYARSQLNRATDARRQPGSIFKPFVYAAALEAGVSPLSLYRDEPREFTYANAARYRPANYGGAYTHSDVTMREALIRSLNVVAVDVALRTGLGRVKRTAERFGLPQPATAYPSMALGATEVSPLEIAAAYTAFANGGRLMRPVVIDRYGDAHGTDRSVTGAPTSEQVIRPETAYVMTDMLRGVIERGTARAARGSVPGAALAGKTGTSRDGWFVGYTPNLVVAVFVGYDAGDDLKLTGGDSALPVWTEFMRAAIELRPELGGAEFTRPAGITIAEIDRESGMLASHDCPHRERVALSAPALLACYKHSASTATQTTDAAPANSVATVAVNETPTPQPHTPTLNTPRTNNESAEPHALRATVRTRTQNGRSMLLNELSP